MSINTNNPYEIALLCYVAYCTISFTLGFLQTLI